MEIRTIKFPVGIGFILLAYLPFLLLGEASYLVEHDNLDSELVYLQMLKLSDNLLGWNGSSIVPNVFNGVPRSYFHSEFSFVRILFYLLPTFWAYVVNSLLVRIIGLVGLLLLTSDYISAVNKGAEVLIIATIFACLPVYTLYGVSILGQPLLLWAFLNLRENRRVLISFPIIILFPFYSHFAMVAPFILVALVLFGMYHLFFEKKPVYSWYWFGIVGLFLSFILSSVSIINNFLFSNTVSHRSAWVQIAPSAYEAAVTSINTFLFGQYHAAYLITAPGFIAAIYVIVKKTNYTLVLIIISLAIATISVFNGIYPILSIYSKEAIPILSTFQFNRFTTLIPVLYFLLLLVICQTKSINKFVLYAVIGIQGVLVGISNKEIVYNYIKLIFPNKSRVKDISSFQSYYAESLFEQVSKYIGVPKKNYRVVSVGIHPSVAQYNGFYTLDGYLNNYPLSYKRSFRKVIAKELDKSLWLKQYFDNWGSRCYIFSAELREGCYVACDRNSPASLSKLSIDMEQLKHMGGRYIFSAVPILNSDELGIKMKRVFTDETSEWTIYLYDVG